MPPKQTQTPEAVHGSLRTSLFFQTFVLLTLAIVASTGTAFMLSWHELRSRSNSNLETLAQAKAGMFEATLASQRESFSLFGRSASTMSISSVTGMQGFRALIQLSPDEEPVLLAGVADISGIQELLPNNVLTIEQTRFLPVVTESAWDSYLLITPLIDEDGRSGTLVVLFDTSPLAGLLSDVSSVGDTAELLFAIQKTEGPIVLRSATSGNDIHFVLASADAGKDPFIEASLAGRTGISEGKDYAGIPVIVASRSLSSVGWAVLVKVDRFEFMRPLIRLALNIIGIGFMLVVLLSLSTFIMSKRIVAPLEDLSQKLQGLETKKWKFERSIFTGNELESVDAAAFDLTKRLRGTYDHLEQLVAERTKELKKELAEKAAILTSMAEGLVVTDEHGVISYMNPAAEKLIGYSGHGAKGLRAEDALVFLTESGEPNAEMHPVSSVLQTKVAFLSSLENPLAIRRTRDAIVTVQVSAVPILLGSECVGVAAVIQDVTEARRLDFMKSEFITLVSHQLRTPVSSMRWYLEMLEDDQKSFSDEQKEYVQQIELANTRMNHLINALLNVSKIELGKYQITPSTTNIAEILLKTQQSLALPLKQKAIKIISHGIDIVPDIRTDQNLLGLILDNLISNAIKYSPEGSTVTIRAFQDLNEKTLLLSFADQGIGIPESEKKEIGQKLFRGTNVRLVDTDGNGLGLYISRLAAETIGARLTFESSEGKGAIFTLHLPLTHQNS